MVTVDENLYKAGVSELRDSLIGRMIHVHGDKPLSHDALIKRMGEVWNIRTPWSLTSLGEGYYNIQFSCDVYWNKHIITALSSVVGTEREVTIMFEWAGHCSFVSVQYERLPEFCKFCSVIAHATGHCGGKSRQGKEPMISKPKEDQKPREDEARAGSAPAKKSDKGRTEGVHCSNSFELLADSATEDAIHELQEKDQETKTDGSVPILQSDQFQVHGNDVQLVTAPLVVPDGGYVEDIAKGRKTAKGKGPLVTKEYNLRNRNNEETHRSEAQTLALGPGIVIPEDKSFCPLQIMYNVARERWGVYVDDTPPKHENQRNNNLPNIWLFCSINTATSATVIGSSEQAILVRARHDMLECTFGFIHAASDHINRRALWSFISGFHCSNLCLVGDFNAILGAHERISSRAPNSTYCAEFLGFIEREELFEVEAAGANFTWASRRSRHGLIASKLDRIIAHESFIQHWDSTSAIVLARAGSDHHPLLLHCSKGSLFRPRPFKFQAAWTLDTRFRGLVCESWDRPSRPSDPISRVIQKLKRLKIELKVWNKEIFGRITTKIAEANQILAAVQSQVYNLGDSEQLLNEEIEATIDLNRILGQQQQFFSQKNRASWLKDGDRNTTFF
ncbi:hypothetical protein ACS0TY_014269 [Phlomoides rotata]